MSDNSGPHYWTQPLLTSPVPPVVINGQAVEAEYETYGDSPSDGQGTVVRTGGGQHVTHHLIPGAGAPSTLAPREVEIDGLAVSETPIRLIQRAQALARTGDLEFWLDVPFTDLWIGDGSRTSFTLSRSTGYGSTGVSWMDRPARCWVGGTEQTMVTGAPSAGECQLSQTANATSITLGAAPASGVLVELRYYPIFGMFDVSISHNLNGFNSMEWSLEGTELIPQRAY